MRVSVRNVKPDLLLAHIIAFPGFPSHYVTDDVVIALRAGHLDFAHFQTETVNVEALTNSGHLADGEIQDGKSSIGIRSNDFTRQPRFGGDDDLGA